MLHVGASTEAPARCHDVCRVLPGVTSPGQGYCEIPTPLRGLIKIGETDGLAASALPARARCVEINHRSMACRSGVRNGADSWCRTHAHPAAREPSAKAQIWAEPARSESVLPLLGRRQCVFAPAIRAASRTRHAPMQHVRASLRGGLADEGLHL